MLNRSCTLGVTAVLFCSLWATACSRPKPITIGSKDTVEQRILGEIVAQLVERRIKTPVVRRLALGDSKIAYQSLIGGEIGMYPEYTGLVILDHLKETPDLQATVVFERARQEMKKIGMIEVLDPLGFDGGPAMLVRASTNMGIDTLTQAAASKTPWKLGVTSEFQSRSEGTSVLNRYHIQMGAPMRALRPVQMFKAVEEGTINMIAGTNSDGHLTTPEWKALADDQKAFAPEQAVLMVREDVLAAEPELRNVLKQLSGKIDLATMRTLNARVEINERTVEDVAREFLKTAGLDK
ncbi:MAG: glycine betaine ABC transporter substrate-binding protein [Acidobacteriota bacterium]